MSDETDGTKPTVDVGPELDSFEQRLQAMMESSDLPESLPRDLVGTTIAGTYTLVGKLGAGGMGEVYLAEHARTEGQVALKLIKSSRLADADGLKRFELEAKNTAALQHPNIVRVFDYGHADDLVYIAMEYVGGKSLREVIEETGTLTVEEAVEVVDAVLLALEAAHEASIVHRDIKAGNILITGTETDRFVKVLDFGIARALDGDAVQTQGIIGSPSSMAPEQFEGGEITPATDLYAVAA